MQPLLLELKGGIMSTSEWVCAGLQLIIPYRIRASYFPTTAALDMHDEKAKVRRSEPARADDLSPY